MFVVVLFMIVWLLLAIAGFGGGVAMLGTAATTTGRLSGGVLAVLAVVMLWAWLAIATQLRADGWVG